jgi:hypothetical protein
MVAMVAVATLVTGIGCGSDNKTGTHDITFMGAVIDGVTSTPLTNYQISAVWGSKTVAGKVDANGRYVLGPVPAWNDYGIIIDAGSGYRAFSSYNAGITPPAPPATSLSSDIYSADTTQTFDFDAYMFPTSIAAPDINIAVLESGPNPMAPSGSIRLQPTTQPTIQGAIAEVGSGTNAQVWANDRDLFAGVVSDTFTNGSYKASGGSLVYGVSYQVTVFGVEGFQPVSGNVQAGVTSTSSLTVVPQTMSPLQLVSNTVSMCHAPAALTDTTSAQVTFTFNQTIEDGTTGLGKGPEALDNGLSIITSLGSSSLAGSTSSTVQERGTTFTLSDRTLSFSWNPSVGLAIKGTGDVVQAVYYNVSSIYLQPAGHPELRASLSQLFQASVMCSGT